MINFLSTDLVYLSGRIRGVPGGNFHRFDHYAAKLRKELGCRIFNPVEQDRVLGFTENYLPKPEDCLPLDTRVVMQSRAIFLIPPASDWTVSRGVRLELVAAVAGEDPKLVYDAETLQLIPHALEMALAPIFIRNIEERNTKNDYERELQRLLKLLFISI